LQQVVGTLKEHGATIVAITPQLAEASRSLIEKQRISFDLLSDPGNAYAAKLGLRFTLPDDLKGVYLSLAMTSRFATVRAAGPCRCRDGL
jgi:peroxiredoxin